LLFGCVQSHEGRQRIAGCIKGHARLEWFDTFADLRSAMTQESASVAITILDLRDPTGASGASFARSLAATSPGLGLVAYCPNSLGRETEICELGSAGVHDVLVAGLTDAGHVGRTIILNAQRRGAVAMVVSELRKFIPARLLPFADTVLRNPARSSVAEIAQIMGIHRQTPNFWCKKEVYLRPEEVLIWCRVFLVAALLELTPRTIESISVEFDYSSPQSLRNQFKAYTGMTASSARATGLKRLIDVFHGRVAQRRAGYSGAPTSPPSAEPSPRQNRFTPSGAHEVGIPRSSRSRP
jgi:AraC-like DNA-binding protein